MIFSKRTVCPIQKDIFWIIHVAVVMDTVEYLLTLGVILKKVKSKEYMFNVFTSFILFSSSIKLKHVAIHISTPSPT